MARNSGAQFDAATRYDRQVRLWGEEGQASIGAATVCVLGSDSLATEILKSLTLAGIQSFHIVDDALVDIADVGQNFFVHADDVGKHRSEATLEKLIELNPQVSGTFSSLPAACLTAADVEKLASFAVVVAANQTEHIEQKFAGVLFELGVPFVAVKTFGLIGTVRVCVKEHTIANTHEENPRPDLRLDVPFPALLEMVNETNLGDLTVEQLRHTPYLLLHFKALEAYRREHNDPKAFPASYAQRQEIQRILRELRRAKDDGSGTKDSENFDEARLAVNRAFLKTTMDDSVRRVLADAHRSTSTQPFWLICEALRRFVAASGGLLPLHGTLPDMTSDTVRYTRLATLFHEKAIEDAQEVLRLTRAVEKERGVGDVISDEMCYRFCKNADRICVQRGERVDSRRELAALISRIVAEEPEEPEGGGGGGRVSAATWILLMRAVERFRKEKGRFPGTNGVPVSIDAQDLRKRVEAIVKEAAESDSTAQTVLTRVPDAAVSEMCRFGAAELHVVSSLIGGIAAQEIIKLATNQYVPIDNTFVFDGHTQHSATLKL